MSNFNFVRMKVCLGERGAQGREFGLATRAGEFRVALLQLSWTAQLHIVERLEIDEPTLAQTKVIVAHRGAGDRRYTL